MPVLGTSPSIFGQAMASYALCHLADQMYSPEGFEPLSKNLKHKLRMQFKKFEQIRFGTVFAPDLDLMDDDDVEFIVEMMWRCRCAVSNKRLFGPAQFTMTRWITESPPDLDNLVSLR